MNAAAYHFAPRQSLQPQAMIKQARANWAVQKHKLKIKLGLGYTNTAKLRKRIRIARDRQRFFEYLCVTKSVFPIGIFLPWLALPGQIATLDGRWFNTALFILKVITFALLSCSMLLEISILRDHFRRLLKRTAKRIARREKQP